MAVPLDDRLSTKTVIRVLALSSAFCGTLIVARMLYSHTLTFGFLGWNLALAWIPLGLSFELARRDSANCDGPRRSDGGPISWTLGVLWMAFFPNAPYLVTDLVHLRARHPVPVWFDAAMLFAFALTGLCVAFTSLLHVHRIVERRVGRIPGWLFVFFVSGLAGFGISLGRFQRWNSWDLLTRPRDLLTDVVRCFLHPLAHPNTAGVTLTMGTLFAISYAMLFSVALLGVPARQRKDSPVPVQPTPPFDPPRAP